LHKFSCCTVWQSGFNIEAKPISESITGPFIVTVSIQPFGDVDLFKAIVDTIWLDAWLESGTGEWNIPELKSRCDLGPELITPIYLTKARDL
jgi:hypothetical protein